ncbi:hypothetical protein DNTS_002482 [Danionella cerebrum]|uniref:Uncharacterized protein n=1 Tax=Danionella cerebrum TaxID=2873325 RepID=A0A553PXL4_9TELE|nr:hypothetical protein DNTS_002482 [Danionella translucida]
MLSGGVVSRSPAASGLFTMNYTDRKPEVLHGIRKIRTIMSSDLLVDLHDDLGGDDSPSAALDQLKLVQDKQWLPDDPSSLSKSASDIKSLGGTSHLPWDDPFYDIARHQIVEVAGDDNFGRKVIVFNACRMPPQHQLDHHKLLM